MGILDFLKRKSQPEHFSEDDSKAASKNTAKWFNTSDIKSMTMGGNLWIYPCDITAITEKMFPTMLFVMGNSERIRRFVPDADFSTEQKAKAYLLNKIINAETGHHFSYCIQQGDGLLGMINIYTPDASKKQMGFPHWTMDFFVLDPVEGKGIMKQGLIRALYQLKTAIHVPEIYALVDPRNTRCLNLMNSLPFDLEDNTGFSSSDGYGPAPKVFVCKLSTLRFERQ